MFKNNQLLIFVGLKCIFLLRVYEYDSSYTVYDSWIVLMFISTVIYRLFQVINKRNPRQGLYVTVSRNIIHYRDIEL